MNIRSNFCAANVSAAWMASERDVAVATVRGRDHGDFEVSVSGSVCFHITANEASGLVSFGSVRRRRSSVRIPPLAARTYLLESICTQAFWEMARDVSFAGCIFDQIVHGIVVREVEVVVARYST